MNVTPIVNKGLSFDLKYYQELKTARSGANFWYVDNSKLLRTKLAPFLPRMEYDAGSGTVTASIVENGQELLSTSVAATPSLNNVPVSELQKLEDLIHNLLIEANKDETPDNVKQLISAFPLPKPNSMPECYRLYGNGPNKKLAIVWGLARKDSEGKEDVSSVVALKDFTYGLEYTPKKSYTWLWILLGIAAAGIAIYCTNGSEGSTTNSDTTTDNPPIAAPPEPDEEIPVVVLTPPEQALSAPQKIEVLKAKEATVTEEIAAIEAKHTELKEKLETMDQQSAEAETARSELDALLARHADLKKKLDAIKTTRTELETAPDVVAPTVEEPTVVLTEEEQSLPTPQKIEVLKAKEATVTEEIAQIEAKQTELEEKLATLDKQSAEAEAARSELDALLARHADLKEKLDAIKTTRETLEQEPAAGEQPIVVTPEPTTGEQPIVVTPEPTTGEQPIVVTPEPTTGEQPIVVTPEPTTGEQPIVVTPEPTTGEQPIVVTPEPTTGEQPTEVTTDPTTGEQPIVVTPEKEATDDILTPEEKNLPAEEQLAILDEKEQAVRAEVEKLKTEQEGLLSEINNILDIQKKNAADVLQLKDWLAEYETLAEKLDSDDLSDEEREQLMQQKTALDEKIEASKQRLGTEAYSIKKERLSAIDERLTKLKNKNAEIDAARKALQSPEVTPVPTPPEVVQKVVNVVINQSTDYKVTYVSNTPITGTDKVLVKLNVSSLKSGLKFSKVTVAGKEVDASGDVELEIQDSGKQELQLKIWVDNSADPKYSAPIPVSTSVTE